MAETKKPRSNGARSGQLQSVLRALDVLEAVAGRGEDAALSDLREELKLPASTVHRLLATLASRGYISQDAYTGRYRIGIRAFEVGNGFLEQTQVRDVARPIMRRLADQADESVNLALPDGSQAVYVEVAECKKTVRTFAHIGGRVPLYCTGVGKALMSAMTTQEVRRIVRQSGLRAHTPSTITKLEVLLDEIARGQDLGFVLDREEYEPGVRCAAAPVRDHSGRVRAAISISGPAFRVTENQLLTMGALVRQGAEELSRALGYQPAPRRGGATRRGG